MKTFQAEGPAAIRHKALGRAPPFTPSSGQIGHFGYIVLERKDVQMTRVTATEFKNNIGAFSDAAMTAPVIITSHQRDRLVLLSAEEYRRLTGVTEGISDSDKERIARGLERHRNTIMELANR